MNTDALPTTPTADSYHVTRVQGLPNRWEVHCWTGAQQDAGCPLTMEWAFTEAFDGPTAEADARELAAYLNSGGC